jgi:hypothetical protein
MTRLALPIAILPLKTINPKIENKSIAKPVIFKTVGFPDKSDRKASTKSETLTIFSATKITLNKKDRPATVAFGLMTVFLLIA